MGDSDWDETNDNMDTIDHAPAVETKKPDFDRVNAKRDSEDNGTEGGQRRRRRNNDDDQQNNDFKSNGDQQNGEQGGFRRRRREDNNDNNADFGGRRNRQNDMNGDQNGGGERRRRNYNQDGNNDQQQEGGGERRRRNYNQDGNNDQQQEGGGERRRRNYNNDNDQQQEGGGERRNRRNRDGDDNGGNAKSGDTEEKKKENYIPREYNKDDEDLFESVGEGINFAKFENIPVQVSGNNPPQPISKFSDVAKDPSIVEAVKKSGYKTLTPIQKYGISVIMNGRDLMASAQTGSGKTMAFLLPIVQNLIQDDKSKDFGDKCSPQALIVTPTRELAIQIYEQALKLCSKNELKPVVVYGGAASKDQQKRISYGANIVVATPGRLLDYLEKGIIKFDKLKFFVLDEADRMIDQGFMPSVKRIEQEFDMPPKNERQTMMFSATFPSEVQRMAQQFLREDYIFLSVGILGVANSDVKQSFRKVEFKAKKGELLGILKEIYKPEERILVFCEKKKTADFLALNLIEHDYKSTSIHGDRLQSQREEALNTFKTGKTPVLVATSVAARGLDIKGVNYVINYDLPSEIEEYVHRVGRTGRVGNSGTSISFYCENDNSALAPKLVEMLNESGQEIPDFLQQYNSNGKSNDNDGERDARHDDVDNKVDFSQTTETHKPTQAADEDDDW